MFEEIDYIVSMIEQEKCVLLLGPEIALNSDNKTILSELVNLPKIRENENIIFYDNEDLFYFKDDTEQMLVYYKIIEYYKQQKPNHIHKIISQIPFNLIFSTSPDLLLKKAFDEQGMNANFGYYSKSKKLDKIDKPTKLNPLIFNIFGSITDDESLIFTHNDLFDYLFSILGSNSLPTDLMNELQSARNFIFIGFKFDRWYLKLIFKLLKIQESNKAKRNAFTEQINTDSVYSNLFKIQFIENKTEEFLNALLEKCKERNLIRTGSDIIEPEIVKLVKKDVANEKTEDAINKLLEFLEDKNEELYDQIILQSGRFKKLQKNINENKITHENAEIDSAKIKSALIEIANEIKNLK